MRLIYPRLPVARPDESTEGDKPEPTPPNNVCQNTLMVLDPNATGATDALPTNQPGGSHRESHERQAALARGGTKTAEDPYVPCAPDVPGLKADLIYTLVAENVRDYAIFLMDADGIIRC
jgi:hypothetical protein